ncbi:hypothetical protein [Devosia lacusdianchii]|uniref:hypothetical protein n=1 Tax=Devosia lacusdianchii TaxID=2917991 RepID=UPI001F06F93A|nr:hypothetical protein [Devosia sp. JXJ CY 41]
MPRRAALALAACLALPLATSLAAECDPRVDMMAPGFSPVAATVNTPAPFHLINECSAGGKCPDSEPLRTGDRIVITSGLDRRLACAVRIGPAPGYAMESGNVLTDLVEPDREIATDWSGSWQSGSEQFIAIHKGNGMVSLSGTATWGMSDPERVAKGAINVGNFGAVAKPKTNRLAFSFDDEWNTLPFDPASTDCSVQLWLAGEFLLAADNDLCGGMNVSFTGVYARQPGTSP